MEREEAREIFNRFLEKDVGILYIDSNDEKYIRGILVLVNSIGIIVKKPNGREVFLNFDAIMKVKEVT